jgi:hypothetical protein
MTDDPGTERKSAWRGTPADMLTDEEIVSRYRGGASLRAIVGAHPLLSYRRVRGILDAAGELRERHGWRAIGRT